MKLTKDPKEDLIKPKIKESTIRPFVAFSMASNIVLATGPFTFL